MQQETGSFLRSADRWGGSASTRAAIAVALNLPAYRQQLRNVATSEKLIPIEGESIPREFVQPMMRSRLRATYPFLLRDGARLKRPMVTIWPRRNVDELSFLQHMHQVPFTLGHNAGFTGTQLNGYIWRGFSGDTKPSRYYVENFVAIGVDLTSMGRVIDDSHDSHSHAIDSPRRTGSMFSGGHRKVSVNVEQMARSVYGDNSVHRVSLLLALARRLSDGLDEADARQNNIVNDLINQFSITA